MCRKSIKMLSNDRKLSPHVKQDINFERNDATFYSIWNDVFQLLLCVFACQSYFGWQLTMQLSVTYLFRAISCHYDVIMNDYCTKIDILVLYTQNMTCAPILGFIPWKKSNIWQYLAFLACSTMCTMAFYGDHGEQ